MKGFKSGEESLLFLVCLSGYSLFRLVSCVAPKTPREEVGMLSLYDDLSDEVLLPDMVFRNDAEKSSGITNLIEKWSANLFGITPQEMSEEESEEEEPMEYPELPGNVRGMCLERERFKLRVAVVIDGKAKRGRVLCHLQRPESRASPAEQLLERLNQMCADGSLGPDFLFSILWPFQNDFLVAESRVLAETAKDCRFRFLNCHEYATYFPRLRLYTPDLRKESAMRIETDRGRLTLSVKLHNADNNSNVFIRSSRFEKTGEQEWPGSNYLASQMRDLDQELKRDGYDHEIFILLENSLQDPCAVPFHRLEIMTKKLLGIDRRTKEHYTIRKLPEAEIGDVSDVVPSNIQPIREKCQSLGGIDDYRREFFFNRLYKPEEVPLRKPFDPHHDMKFQSLPELDKTEKETLPKKKTKRHENSNSIAITPSHNNHM